MNLICAPENHPKLPAQGRTCVLLYSRNHDANQGGIGVKVYEAVRRLHLSPAMRAWDFLSIALSVIAADHGCSRKTSADGWTRLFNLEIAVIDPDFWNSKTELLQEMLCFLTTDVWMLRFIGGGAHPPCLEELVRPDQNCVALLSGGLDSLVGTIDLLANNRRPFAVSQMVAADSLKQRRFANELGMGDNHIQFNHDVKMPSPENPPSDRGRSIIFMAYGVLLASCTQSYAQGKQIPLVIAENGFISLNPPLTAGRLGSLSTRTTHPYFLGLLGKLLAECALNVDLRTPYQFKTKGEMLRECRNQKLITRLAHESTSCGRYARYGRTHCGKCLPCLIRRAAFYEWGSEDPTCYYYSDLSIHEKESQRFDDVRSAAMAIMRIEKEGLESWLGGSLNADHLGDIRRYKDVAMRGTEELGRFLRHAGVL